MPCRRDHSRIASILEELPTDQGGRWRHKCAGCAYEAGYEAGYNHESQDIDEVLETGFSSSSKTGSSGVRYSVKIAGQRKIIWRDGRGFFVECPRQKPF